MVDMDGLKIELKFIFNSFSNESLLSTGHEPERLC